jgi:DNA primase small subunit
VQAPFCVHPKTGKVCVPIEPEHVWEFDPDGGPTVSHLIKQLETAPPPEPADQVLPIAFLHYVKHSALYSTTLTMAPSGIN